MNIRRGFAATATSLLLMSAATPVLAEDGAIGAAPVLLSDPNIAWVSGSTGWVNLSWTAQEDLQNIKVTLDSTSKGFSVEYPENHDGYTGLMVDADLSTHEIDFTAVKVSTDGKDNGTKWADVIVEWDFQGQHFQTKAGRLKFSNKKYKGDDFAILTEAAAVTSGEGVANAANWIELGYLGLSPNNSDLQMTVKSSLPVYHPQGSYTSLHHDEQLHGGESDVARVWFDPELIAPGSDSLIVEISYRDFKGSKKSIDHVVALTVG